jgi:hypothetical protein
MVKVPPPERGRPRAQLGERAGFQRERLARARAHVAQAARLGLAAEAAKAGKARELAERALQARAAALPRIG